MSPKRKAEQAQAKMLGLEEIDRDDLMVCGGCGNVFSIDIADACPHCKGLGNPGPDEEKAKGKPDFDQDGGDFSPWDSFGED